MLRLFDVRKAKATVRIEPWLLFILLSLVELKCHIENRINYFSKSPSLQWTTKLPEP